MPQDHFVAQTYLKAFADPATVKDPEKGGQIHAYNKAQDGKHFFPFAGSICKTLDWDQNPMLSPPDALGQWLRIYEPHWAGAVARLATTHHLSTADKFVISGYWAHLSTCTPTWQRVATSLQQDDIENVRLPKFIDYALAHPEEFPQVEEYIKMIKDGSVRIEVDKNYPKAIVTKQLLPHLWGMFHREWSVIYNNTDELFITSDNPSCFDYDVYGSDLHPARYLPLTPRLALWASMGTTNIPKKIDPNAPPQNKSVAHEANEKFVKGMNVLIIKSAERIVLAAQDKSFIGPCVKKYKDWQVARVANIRIPADDGYYEVVQTRPLSRTPSK